MKESGQYGQDNKLGKMMIKMQWQALIMKG